jgi:CBS domain-containing protein
MKKLAVESIIRPMEEEITLKPFVGPQDRIMEAIEVMLRNDLKRIAVIEGRRTMGMITLDDALKRLGLKEDVKSKGSRVVVFQGRKFILDK